MSHLAYNKQWAVAQATLTDLLEIEQPKQPPKPEKDRIAVFQHLSVLYIKYVQIFRKLEQCYDQIVHPQKQTLLRHIIDGVMGRILELKNNMVLLEFSEFHYFDDVLADLKLTPDDLEICIPKYFHENDVTPLKTKLDLVPEKQQFVVVKKEAKEEIEMTRAEAIRLIQIHERARQGRLRAKFMIEIRAQEEREKLAATCGPPTLSKDEAAVQIQKMWKGFSTRKATLKMREEELIFVGMKPASETAFEDTQMYQAEKVEAYRRTVQRDNVRKHAKALVTIKERIREMEGPEMRENMQDQIRQWFIECRDATGKFPEYPSDSEGGSNAIFKPKPPEEKEETDQKDSKGGKETKGKEKVKKDKGKEKGKEKGKDKKGKKDEAEEEGITFEPSCFVPTVAETEKEYNEVWQGRDESGNFHQGHDSEIIREQKRVEVEEELRTQIDELMRQELKNLKLAVERDKGKKGKKGKKSGKGKKKKSGKKGGKKGRKGKKEKDLTAHRTIESLTSELRDAGILRSYPHVQLQDFVGDYSYLGMTLREANIEPMPSLSDVRRVITQFCILPLGSQIVHEKAPLVKSVLITSPRGCGKRMLLNAICTEVGAMLFDLSAETIVGQYPGKAGLKMLLHMVFKVARELPPAVVYIGDCEKMFQKKIPKTDKTDPKRLKKHLPKIVKGMKAGNRTLLVGTSNEPFNAEVKPLCSTYSKILLIPRPDYASRFLLWPHLIKKYGGAVTDAIDLSSLTKITDGYTAGHIVNVIRTVLTEKRIKNLEKKPLTASEFVPALAKIEPIYKDVEEKFKVWYAKTPLGKKRAKAAKEGEEEGGDKKGKGKKKK